MTRNGRVALAALCAIVLAAVTLPATVGAQKVLNPGSFSLQSTGGQILVGSLGLDLTPQPLPQCSDGVDNDADGKIDDVDNQCAVGPNGEPKSSDDSELAPNFQAKVNTSISGTVDKNGVVSIPTSGVVFPPAYIGINFNGLWVVKAEVIATQTATGTINPLTGAAVLDVAVRVKLSGNVGNPLSSTCSIGTNNNPIRLNLITGRKEAIGTNGAITGSPYNATTGNALLVDNAFAVPGASNCTAGIFDLNSTISGQVGLPSAAGKNAAVLAGKTTPVLSKAISPVITSSVPLSGNEAPFSVTLSGASSSVAAAPASYSWLFSDGTTATGEYVDKTFAAGNQSATLTVTDADGDSSSVTSFFVVNPGSATTTTTTTTAPTTTTTSTTSTTTTSTTTTTTEPPTTTTTTTEPPTTTTTTTTVPPTTSTTTTSTTSTTTTVPPTTSTTTTTVPPTTSTTTTTAAPTTTTSTTIPAPSNDSVSVRLSGALTYANQGSGNGNVTVRRDANGISSVSGFLDIAGTQGGTARVSVGIQRAWILPLWSGQVSVKDAGAGINASAPVFGQISRGDTLTSAKGTSSWFITGAFPNLIKPYTFAWSVTDAG